MVHIAFTKINFVDFTKITEIEGQGWETELNFLGNIGKAKF